MATLAKLPNAVPTRRSPIKWAIGSVIAIALAVGLYRFGKIDIEWEEDVELASEQVILVKRTAQGDKLGEIGGTGGWDVTRMSIEIIEPKLPTNPPVWSEPWVPMVFDRDPDTGEWFVIATFYVCRNWNPDRQPMSPYLQFQVHQGRWERVPLDPKLIGREANMLVGVRSGGEPYKVGVGSKKHRDHMAADMYKKVLSSRWKSC